MQSFKSYVAVGAPETLFHALQAFFDPHLKPPMFPTAVRNGLPNLWSSEVFLWIDFVFPLIFFTFSGFLRPDIKMFVGTVMSVMGMIIFNDVFIQARIPT